MGSYNYYKMFGCFNRKFKISETEPPPDVMNVFRKYSEGGAHMTADQFAKFLVEYQGEEGCTVADAESMMHQVIHCRHHLTKYARRTFALEDFFFFLFQDNLNGPIRTQVHHDMTAPLQQYFIYTGHNSYLTGNQLSSDCSEIPIVKALERGVRGIELDLWPNSAKDNVHVLHGRTLTTPVTLIKCLKSIKEHAFVKSPYPVIITLEDHLNPELQAKVAEMVTQIFGEMLFYPESGYLEEFPSPEALKHRIILSTKPPKEYLDLGNQKEGETSSPVEKDSSEEDFPLKETPDRTTESESDAKYNSDVDDEYGDIQNPKSSQLAPSQYKRLSAIHTGKGKQELRHSLVTGIDKVNRHSFNEQEELEKDSSEEDFSLKEIPERTTESESDAKGSDPDDEYGDIQNPKSSQLATSQYKRLIAIHAGKAKHGLRHALVTGLDKVNRLSFNEQELEKAASLYGTDVVRFTQKNILRVYPKGTRVTSSNFQPFLGWMHGAQMLAFNMQGYGKSLWLMQGLFRSNGGCGFVKKPEFLMKRGLGNEVFDPTERLPVKKTLMVRVYLGDGWRLDFSHTHFDTFSPPDFYTKVQIVGVPADEAKKKTKVIVDDWGPIWDEIFTFPLTVPELALLWIEIGEHDMSEKDDFGGQTCLPVSELRPGIRAVPLYDKKGEKLRSVRLLMEFQFI